MSNFLCTECNQGTVRDQVVKNYATKIKDQPVIIPEATIGICDKCGEKFYQAKEMKRWRQFLKEESA